MNPNLLQKFKDQNGTTIYDHSCAAPLLLVLLRHAGCPFCRRALKELSDVREQYERSGYHIGIVHMGAEENILLQLENYDLVSIPRFRDSKQELYRELDLERFPLRQLFNAGNWKESLSSSLEFGASWPDSDLRQLPGAFLIDQGMVLAGHRSLTPSEPPDFSSMMNGRMKIQKTA